MILCVGNSLERVFFLFFGHLSFIAAANPIPGIPGMFPHLLQIIWNSGEGLKKTLKGLGVSCRVIKNASS